MNDQEFTFRQAAYAKKEEFTIEMGLAIQKHQLLGWKSILKPEKYALLEKHYEELNSKLLKTDNGYKVSRGVDIDNWIANNLKERPTKKEVEDAMKK